MSDTFFTRVHLFYFSRRIPRALRDRYSAPRIAYALRTKSPCVAEAGARKAADQLDEYWNHLQSRARTSAQSKRQG